jgi:hypothetical protein
MNRLLFGISAILHPIFLPLLTILILRNEPFKLFESGFTVSLLWVLMLSLIIPYFYFSRFKPEVSITQPTVSDRTSIYGSLTLLYGFLTILIALFSPYLFPAMFVYFSICLVLWFATLFSLTWSWHTAGFGALLSIVFMHFMNGRLAWAGNYLPVFFGIAILVFALRKIQKAHSLNELIFGFLLGFLFPMIIYFRTLI